MERHASKDRTGMSHRLAVLSLGCALAVGAPALAFADAADAGTDVAAEQSSNEAAIADGSASTGFYMQDKVNAFSGVTAA